MSLRAVPYTKIMLGVLELSKPPGNVNFNEAPILDFSCRAQANNEGDAARSRLRMHAPR